MNENKETKAEEKTFSDEYKKAFESIGVVEAWCKFAIQDCNVLRGIALANEDKVFVDKKMIENFKKEMLLLKQDILRLNSEFSYLIENVLD